MTATHDTEVGHTAALSLELLDSAVDLWSMSVQGGRHSNRVEVRRKNAGLGNPSGETEIASDVGKCTDRDVCASGKWKEQVARKVTIRGCVHRHVRGGYVTSLRGLSVHVSVPVCPCVILRAVDRFDLVRSCESVKARSSASYATRGTLRPAPCCSGPVRCGFQAGNSPPMPRGLRRRLRRRRSESKSCPRRP